MEWIYLISAAITLLLALYLTVALLKPEIFP